MKSIRRPASYRIRVRGQLAPRWTEWLDRMAIEYRDCADETVLTGQIVDQAALLGLLQKLANLGLTLLEVAADQGEPEQEVASENQEKAS